MFKLIISCICLNLSIATGASYFEQESEMAQKSLSQKNAEAKIALTVAAATVIKKNDSVNFIVYRSAHLGKGEVFIDNIKATQLHSFTDDYNFALVVDPSNKLAIGEDSAFYQLLVSSPYRSYQFVELQETSTTSKFPLSLPTKSELSLIKVTLGEGQESLFSDSLKLMQCNKEIMPKQSSDTIYLYSYKESSKCPLHYTYQRSNKDTKASVFFAMVNNAPAVVLEKIERSRDILDRYQRLLRAEEKKVKKDQKAIADYTNKIEEEKIELKNLKEFLNNVNE